ncbi:hypothetical protein HHI36_003973 [Cryptolaemus montrouzieri]|uniref:VWFA domain-containing protein n=1 Tax=Cryptolaemus montrouzieri TaxID=559131 RepID=A0ABD2NQL4_9CUCU
MNIGIGFLATVLYSTSVLGNPPSTTQSWVTVPKESKDELDVEGPPKYKVNIHETRPLSFVKVPSLRSGNKISKSDEKLDPKADIHRIDKSTASVTFKPDNERQQKLAKNLGTKEGDGLAGQFVVQYDVERDAEGGEILVSNGFFVHFFAPNDLKPLPKHVIFVLDTSGSMSGRRISQLKKAMKSILDQLKNKDSFNIVEFNSAVEVWNIPNEEVQYQEGARYYYWPKISTPQPNMIGKTLPGSYEASKQNINHAKSVVDKFEALGSTNIYSALKIALRLVNENEQDDKQPIIMFLTDGEPTDGETNTETIITDVTKANIKSVPIFSLSFGQDADRSFLMKLSLKNHGFSKHIYEAADANLQLEAFYKYISSPLLNKVNFQYSSEAVSKLTKTVFPILFDGAELVVAGNYPLPIEPPNIDPELSPRSKRHINHLDFVPYVKCYAGPIQKEFKPKFENPIGSLEKHWAHLTLKQILDERDVADNKTELTKKALDLALKYSLVTPVSSLVVVKPNKTKTETNLEDASTDGASNPQFAHHLYSAPIPTYRPSSTTYPLLSSRNSTYRPNSGNYPLLSSRNSTYRPNSGNYPLLSSRNSTYRPDIDPLLPSRNSTYRPDSEIVLVTRKSTYRPNSGNSSDDTGFFKPIPTPAISKSVGELIRKLPWLTNIFNAANNTIKLTQGEYILDSEYSLFVQFTCRPTPTNKTGTCKLLKDCPEVHDVLTDLTTYSKYFCTLNEYAGVCCPVQYAKLRLIVPDEE